MKEILIEVIKADFVLNASLLHYDLFFYFMFRSILLILDLPWNRYMLPTQIQGKFLCFFFFKLSDMQLFGHSSMD